MLTRLRDRWRNEKAGEGWLNPLYFSLGTRWLTWFTALGIIALGAAPEVNLNYGKELLALTCVQLTLMHAALSRRAPHIPCSPIFAVLDIGAALGCVFLTGGWDSPFYEFALTSVIAPSLIWGLRGATLASLGFCVTYAWILTVAGHGQRNFITPEGRLEGAVVSCLVNPYLVAYFSAFLAELMERLKREQERVRRLAAQEERNRLARDIHDGVAQTLFMLTLSLEACAEHARRGNSGKLADKLEGLVSVSRNALWDIRQSMFDLEGEANLKDALARLLREFKTVSQIPIEFTTVGEERSLPLTHRAGLCRILQESLANACKHSQAQAVSITLQYREDATELTIHDDGKGFDPATIERGKGLGNLQSRAAELGGTLDLRSSPGQGTKVALTLPRKEGP